MASGKWLRQGFVDSGAVNALSDWAHRVYSNLILESDNVGRHDGRPEILRSRLFPLGTSRRAEDFQKAVQEMESQRLVIAYSFAGKPYLQLTKVERVGKTHASQIPWRDGSLLVSYTKMLVPDAVEGQKEKEFVTTSLILDPLTTPTVSPSDPQPIPLVISNCNSSKSQSENGIKSGREIPESLDSPEFREAWMRWETHRQEIRKKLTPTSVKQQMEKLKGFGCDRAIAALNNSIANGYTGIFENETKKGSNYAGAVRKPVEGEYPTERRTLPVFGTKSK